MSGFNAEALRTILDTRPHGCLAFVETGTFQATTTVLAASFFDEVHSIELSEALYRKAVAKYGDLPSIKFYRGDSPMILVQLASNLDYPVMFYTVPPM